MCSWSLSITAVLWLWVPRVHHPQDAEGNSLQRWSVHAAMDLADVAAPGFPWVLWPGWNKTKFMHV